MGYGDGTAITLFTIKRKRFPISTTDAQIAARSNHQKPNAPVCLSADGQRMDFNSGPVEAMDGQISSMCEPRTSSLPGSRW